MKPKAWLKSAKTNFLLMASRSLTSLQPLSRPNAVLRASPESLPLIVCSIAVRAASPPRRCHPRKYATKCLAIKTSWYEAFREGRYGLVAENRIGRGYRGPDARHVSLISRVDFRRQLRGRRPTGGLERPPFHGAAVRLRAAP